MSSPIFSIILSLLILKEKFNIYLGLSVIVGLIGVALVIQPGFGAFNKFFLLVLLGAFLISGANLIVNKFNKEVSPLGYFIYGGFFVHLTCAVLFIADPIFLRFSEMILIFIASLFVNSAVLLIGIAFQLAQRHYASISCLIYIQILWSSLVGLIIFEEYLTIASWAGVSLILLSAILAIPAQRHQVRRKN